jgi:RecJ-like exonuclease
MAVTDKDRVAAEPCHCVQCEECNGNGHVWFDFRGKYLGNHRSDDMDELEQCETCGSRGIIETCDRCQLLEEMDQEEHERR